MNIVKLLRESTLVSGGRSSEQRAVFSEQGWIAGDVQASLQEAGGAPESAAERKRREKQERKSSRVRYR